MGHFKDIGQEAEYVLAAGRVRLLNEVEKMLRDVNRKHPMDRGLALSEFQTKLQVLSQIAGDQWCVQCHNLGHDRVGLPEWTDDD